MAELAQRKPRKKGDKVLDAIADQTLRDLRTPDQKALDEIAERGSVHDLGTIGPIERRGIWSRLLGGYGDLLARLGELTPREGRGVGPHMLFSQMLADTGEQLRSSGSAIQDWAAGFSPIQATPTGGFVNPRVDSAQLIDVLSGLIPAAKVARSVPGAVRDASRDMIQAQLSAVPRVTAYHGSPHDFDVFDIGKVGTGLRAQAQGHGLYFAESPEVARGFFNAGQGSSLQFNGKPLSWLLDSDVSALPAATRQALALMRDEASVNDARTAIRSGIYPQEAAKEAQRLIDTGAISEYTGGALYTVDIRDDAIRDALKWNEPLSAQRPEIRALASELRAVSPDGLDVGGGRILDNRKRQANPNSSAPWVLRSGDALFNLSQKDVDRMLGPTTEGMTGEQFYTRLSAQLGSQEKASQFLRSRGVPAIEYTERGKRNFVVFDDKDVKMLAKDGKPHSPEFREWFGKSQVADERGAPRVVYHGTGADFDEFAPKSFKGKRSGHFLDFGIHFSTQPRLANDYATLAEGEFNRYRRGMSRDQKPGNPTVYPAYLSAQKVADLRDKMPADLRQHVIDLAIRNGVSPRSKFIFLADADPLSLLSVTQRKAGRPAMQKLFTSLGYDGIVYNWGGADNYVVFRPEQIKSATGNRGTYSRQTSKITE